MKLGDWKNAARLPRPKVLEVSSLAVERFGVIDPPEPRARVLQFGLRELATNGKFTVAATSQASAAMSALGHPGNLMVEHDKNVMSDSISLTFYGMSGEGDRVKQVFEARFSSDKIIEVIITPFRPSEVYALMGESDSTITSRRLYDACLKDLRMLRGWPPETEFEAKRWLEKGVEGRVVFAGGSGRARADLLFNASLSPEGKLSAALPLFPHSHLEIATHVIAGMK